MASSRYLTVSDAKEIESLIGELPIAVDREHFTDFVLGFPRHYLLNTLRVDIVKHYLLAENLGTKAVISSLSQENNLWKLSLVTRDHSFLFSRIAGALSYTGMNIVSAEAFANANSLVLDTFYFLDRDHHFTHDKNRQNFQYFLEEIIEGKAELESLLRKRWEEVKLTAEGNFVIVLDNDSYPSATRLALNCRDHFGLLYLVSRCISEEGYNIEMAYIETPGQSVQDEFYLTREGAQLTPSMQQDLKGKLTHLGKRYFRLDSALIK